MPELPEVQTTVNGLNTKVLERTFVDVWSDWEKIVKKPKSFKDFKKEVIGKKIIKAYRRAKNIIIDLSEGYSLLIHQKMTGHLLAGKWIKLGNNWKPEKDGPLSDPYNRFLHIIFFFDNGLMLALSDARKFAKVELWKTEELLNSKEFLTLGPEPLDKSFTFDRFKERLKDKKGKIKQVIMDPAVIAGIGNIYSSEVLWWVKINPEKPANKLTEKELMDLYNAIKKVLSLALSLGGESFSDYRNIDGNKGNFDNERKVYKKEKQPCEKCGTPIKRIQFGGRSAFYCPTCQKM